MFLLCAVFVIFLLNPFSSISTNAATRQEASLDIMEAKISEPSEIVREVIEIGFPQPLFGKEEYAGEEWDTIKMEDTLAIPLPGHPRVPIKVVTIENLHLLKSIEVEYSGITYISLNLVPAPKARLPYEIENSEYIDKSAYGSDTFLPGEDYKMSLLGGVWKDGYRYWSYSLALFPVRFNPSLNEAQIYDSARVVMKFDGDSEIGVQSFVSGDRESDPVTPGITPSTDGSTRSSRSGETPDPDYIIITTSTFTNPLAKLAAWKTKKGVPCEVYSTQNIYTSYEGVDNPEKIRNFIKDMHNQYGITYVLLAGDYNHVPVRLCKDPSPYPGWDDGWIPSDQYYACLDRTWNADGDAYWGENGDIQDILSDVYLSRIAISSYSSMNDWAQSVIDYEKSPPGGNWMEKVVLIGADSHRTGDAAIQCDYLYDKYLNSAFKDTDKFYENGGTIQKSDVKTSLNSGAGYVNFVDHGGPTVWCQNGGNQVLFSNNDVSTLSNGLKKPLISGMACMTSWFDDPSGCGYQNFGDCIGETFTENAQNRAIAYIGSSRSATAVIGYDQYAYGAGGLQEDLCYQLAADNLHIGATHTKAKDHYAYSFGNWFSDTEESDGEIQSCWLELNMLGEPEVPLWTKVPKAFQVNVTITQQRINVTVKETGTGSGVQGAQVCIQGSGQYMRGVTSSGGIIGFNNPVVEGSADVTVTKPNYYTYETMTPFIDVIPPITEYAISPKESNGLNGWYNETPTISLLSEEWSSIRYSLDEVGDDFVTYTKPIRIPNGEITFRYYSEDNWGNPEVTRTNVIRVDSITPVTIVEVDPEDPSGTSGWYNSITNVSLIAGEDEIDTYYRILLDGEPIGGFSIYTIPLSLKLEGNISIQYYSKDSAGNMEELLVEELRIDRIPPEVFMDVDRVPGKGNWHSEIPSISLSSTDELDIIYYYFDDNKPRQYTRTFVPDEGTHVLHCYSMDAAGNTAEERTMEFKVDTTPPDVTCVISPQHPNGLSRYYVTMPEITFFSEENVSINYSWDTEVFYEYDGDIIIPPSEGVVEITYYGVDHAGNVGDMESNILMIDITPPTTTALLEPEEPNGDGDWYSSLEIELNSPMKDTVAIYYYFEDPDESEIYSVTISGDEIPEGIHTLVYYSTDRSGNKERENELLIKYDSNRPKPYLEVSTEKAVVGDTVTINAGRSKDDCGGILLYLVDFGDGEKTRWTKRTEFTHPYSEAGQYIVKLRVKDEAGHEASVEETIVIDELSFMDTVNNYRGENPAAFYGIVGAVMFVILGLIVVLVLVQRRKRRKDLVTDLSPDDYAEVNTGPDPWAPSTVSYPSESDHFRVKTRVKLRRTRRVVGRRENTSHGWEHRGRSAGPVSAELDGWENERAWDFGTSENTADYYSETGEKSEIIGDGRSGETLLSLPEPTHGTYETDTLTSDHHSRNVEDKPLGDIFDFRAPARFPGSGVSEVDERIDQNGNEESSEENADHQAGKGAVSANDPNDMKLDNWNI